MIIEGNKIEETCNPKDSFPRINHGSIYQYVINTTDPISMNQKNAYKTLESHKYFIDGWVKSVRTKELKDKKVFLVFGQVCHSFTADGMMNKI